jgi:NADH-quinone oxidoreductase subunit N
MPSLGGFVGKFFLLMAMLDSVGTVGMVLVAVLLFNTLISLYFYARPIYFMYFVPDKENRAAFVPQGAGVLLMAICAVMLVWTGIYPEPARELAQANSVIKQNATARAVEAPAEPAKVSQAN